MNKRLLIVMILITAGTCFSQSKRAMTLKDVMQFKQIKSSVISDYGNWVAYEAAPDRGNGEVVIQSTRYDIVYNFKRGTKPVFSENEKWVSIKLKPDFAKAENSKNKLPADLLLLNTESGDTLTFSNFTSSSFSNDSKWLAVHFKEFFEKDSSGKKTKKQIGKPLVLKNLDSSREDTIQFVSSFAFDSLSTTFAYVVSDTNASINGLYFVNLNSNQTQTVDTTKNCSISNLLWKQSKLAYTKATFDEKGKTDTATLRLWNGSVKTIVTTENDIHGYYLSSDNKLKWSDDGKRLFFSYKLPLPQKKIADESDTTVVDLFDFDNLLAKTTLDVWHWDDPLINSNQKKEWKNKKKEKYTSVYWLEDNRIVNLADEEMPHLRYNENPYTALGIADEKYHKLRTWDSWYSDYFIVDITNGERKQIAKKLYSTAQLSPAGKFVVYYNENEWYLYNIISEEIIDLTSSLKVPFENEDYDYPSKPTGYGIAGWTENDESVLVYDKYDIWQFNTNDGSVINLTNGVGREKELTFRIKKLDNDQKFFESGEELLLTAFHNKEKYVAIYSAKVDEQGVEEIVTEAKKFEIKMKAKKSYDILFTRETYDEFPDLWVTSDNFETRKRLTNLDNQRDPFAWGKADLIEWNSIDGKPLQGVVIKPGNYEKGKRYPVLVYYYRTFSQRVHDFNDMVVNHRPNFPFYASNDYVVFLPDIKFDVGLPGYSATKCLVPGMQKIIDMGIADPNGIGLHGHSWSGYQTAFVITQTDIFACAIAGAPVSNMTSAYSGIRWGTGLARQFQYEQSQSRIGGSLWEKPELYIENSPVFFADRINTPLLIQHGDVDEAVPWYQGIEMYLAMRRLGKDCVFLQYGDEPHHLKKYPNKLDYSIKMKEYLDHYCKGEPAADWIKNGVPYVGD
jgi:dipeptidyl aminopeptidase/acylaminoacyl peptidase